MTKQMEKGFTSIRMAKLMKEIGWTTYSMAMEQKSQKMDLNILVSSETGRSTAQVSMLGPMELTTKASGITIRQKVLVSISGQMAEDLKVVG